MAYWNELHVEIADKKRDKVMKAIAIDFTL